MLQLRSVASSADAEETWFDHAGLAEQRTYLHPAACCALRPNPSSEWGLQLRWPFRIVHADQHVGSKQLGLSTPRMCVRSALSGICVARCSTAAQVCQCCGVFAMRASQKVEGKRKRKGFLFRKWTHASTAIAKPFLFCMSLAQSVSETNDAWWLWIVHSFSVELPPWNLLRWQRQAWTQSASASFWHALLPDQGFPSGKPSRRGYTRQWT